MSNLYWRMGFGWGNILFFITPLLAAFFISGIFKWILIAVSAFSFLMLIVRYNRWNGRGWRSVHGRAMLTYAALAAEEVIEARDNHRDFDPEFPSRKLAYRLVGYGKQNEADAMVDALLSERGQYFSYLIENYLNSTFPEVDSAGKERILQITEGLDFGPQLVIANVIENTYGGDEATRYIIAVLKGDAA